jgi:hypothetical protein
VFKEIGGVIHALKAELQANGLNVNIDVHEYAGGYLLGLCGWWVTISWQPRGPPGESYLSMVTFRGRPNVPGLQHSFDLAEIVDEQQYQYGLARVDSAGWIEPQNPDVALGTREILERPLTKLFENPNDEPAPIWDLSRDSD